MNIAYRFAEIRLAEIDGKPSIQGTVVRYGDTAELMGFKERMLPGSLRFADVLVNLMHQRERPIARSGAGLILRDTGTALEATITPANIRDGQEALELVRAGVLKGLSAEFKVDRNGERQSADGIREITSAELTGLGIVDRPAYPQSLAQVAKRYAPNRGRRIWL